MATKGELQNNQVNPTIRTEARSWDSDIRER
eukprot:CAMPEP_0178829044 /NCGR_PEP_ID=MMETSP0746-20121128/8159_1 /TAXON_ID=913974 /ORGANISM="Nitzschia punctata, Strain CCMP561" /LENGTH=30 /DNA_ID= /DNA_START= /DNA_END= /DNA_ORIENTATION=